MKKLAICVAIFALLMTGCSIKNTATSGEYGFAYNNFAIKNSSNSEFVDNSSEFTNSNPSKAKDFGLDLDKYVNTRIGRDCSGLVSVINDKNDKIFFEPRELNKYFNNTRKSQAIFNLYKAHNKIVFTQPKAGDLIFFNNTTRDTKRKKNGAITHVGIIDEVKSDGSIIFLHNSGGKNIKSVMSLKHKNSHDVGGKKVNAYLISRCSSIDCLASNRFAGYGRVE